MKTLIKISTIFNKVEELDQDLHTQFPQDEPHQLLILLLEPLDNDRIRLTQNKYEIQAG